MSATLLESSPAIRITWPTAVGTTSYVLERRTDGSPWVEYKILSNTTEYLDTNLPANKTFAYRVKAYSPPDHSSPTNVDVATTMSFSAVTNATTVSSSHWQEVLNAVNAVRAAAGWTPVTWENILSATDQLPAPGATVRAKHIYALRLRMNEALQALGVSITVYTDPDLEKKSIKDEHIGELQRRAQ